MTDDPVITLLERAAPPVDTDAAWRQISADLDRHRRRCVATRALAVAAAVAVIAVIAASVLAVRRDDGAGGQGVQTGGSTGPAPSQTGPTIPSAPSPGPAFPAPDDASLPDVADLECTPGGGTVTPRVHAQLDGVHVRYHGREAYFRFPGGDGSQDIGGLGGQLPTQGVIPLTAGRAYDVQCQLNVNDPASMHSAGSLAVVDPGDQYTPAPYAPACPTYAVSGRGIPGTDAVATVSDRLAAVIGQPVTVVPSGYTQGSEPTVTGTLDGRTIATGLTSAVFGLMDYTLHICTDAPHVPTPSSPLGRTVPDAQAAIDVVGGTEPNLQTAGAEAKFASPAELRAAARFDIAVPAPGQGNLWFVLARRVDPSGEQPPVYQLVAVDPDDPHAEATGPGPNLDLYPTPVNFLTADQAAALTAAGQVPGADPPPWWDGVPNHA